MFDTFKSMAVIFFFWYSGCLNVISGSTSDRSLLCSHLSQESGVCPSFLTKKMFQIHWVSFLPQTSNQLFLQESLIIFMENST